jgi:quercetin dioxygenase-like cupin family protein
MSRRVATEADVTGADALRQIVHATSESELALSVVRLPDGASFALPDTDTDRLLYTFEGSGSIELEGTAHALSTGSAALASAGEDALLEAAPRGLAVILATVGPGTDRHAPLGQRETVVRIEDAGSGRATGARSFEILFGPHNGSTRATLFVGHLPPGKAPWHYHLYDEIVWIPEGPGRLHLRGGVEDLAAGFAFRLHPREVHIVENVSDDREMTLLGIFTPAGSPSAAFLTNDVAAEYRFDG